MISRKTLFSLTTACLLSGMSAALAVEARIAGSDLLASTFKDTLPELAENAGHDVELDLHGSIPALNKLYSGEADLAIVAVPDGMEKPSEGVVTYPFAFKVSYVVLNNGNLVNEINYQQLAGIFGTSARLNMERWRDLGQVAGGTRAIVPVIENDEHRTVLNLFKYTVMEGSQLKPRVEMVTEPSRLLETLEADSSLIGVIGFEPQSEVLKVLPVARGAGGEENFAFGPSPRNVFHGDYPLRLPLYLVVPQAKQQEMQPLIRFLLSAEVAELLEGEHFMAIPEENRRNILMGLDN